MMSFNINTKSDLTVDHIPKKFFSTFSNLKHLSVHSEVKEIFAEDFINATKLNYLNLESNKLNKLRTGIFHQCLKLDHLNLGSNTIENIDDFTFTNQSDLSILLLHENQLAVVKQNTFAGLSRLRDLNLRKNLIEIIEDGALTHLPNLVYLTLDGNKLKILGDSVFDGLRALEAISIAGNQLEKIGDSFCKLASVTSIYLDFNRINDSNIYGFAKLPKLTILQLEASGVKLNNFNITTESSQIISSPLRSLNLSFNNLTNAGDVDVLPSIFPKLSFLTLIGNNFTRLNLQQIRNKLPKSIRIFDEFNKY